MAERVVVSYDQLTVAASADAPAAQADLDQVGFACSLLATSERQAMQFSLLALLRSVVFSGFALPLNTLRQPALTMSYALAVTYGASCYRM